MIDLAIAAIVVAVVALWSWENRSYARRSHTAPVNRHEAPSHMRVLRSTAVDDGEVGE